MKVICVIRITVVHSTSNPVGPVRFRYDAQILWLKIYDYKEFSVNNVDNSIIDINVFEIKINTKNIKISFQMKENIGV